MPARPRPRISGDVQPRLGPSDSAYIRPAGPAPASRNPPRSKRPASGSRCSCRNSDAEDERRDTDRHVDVEHPPPGHVGDEQTAEHRARAPARTRSGRSGSARRAPARPAGRCGTASPSRPASACRRRRPAGCGRSTSWVEALRQAAQRGCAREDDDRNQQHPLHPEPVTEPTRGGDEHRQADQEAHHDAVDVIGAHVKVASPAVGSATLTIVMSMIAMNIAETNTTLTEIFGIQAVGEHDSMKQHARNGNSACRKPAAAHN